MRSPHTRRRTLQLTGAALTAGLAGCSALPISGGSDGDPDAGTDSYGIRVENEVDDAHTVAVEAATLDGETLLDENVEMDPDGSHEWDSVLTTPGMTQVKARLDPGTEDEKRDSMYVDVGSERTPAVPNVVVRVYEQEVMTGDGAEVQTFVGVSIPTGE